MIPDRKLHFSDFDHFEVRFSSKKVSRSFGKDCTIFGKEDFSRKNLGNIKETERQFLRIACCQLLGREQVGGWVHHGWPFVRAVHAQVQL